MNISESLRKFKDDALEVGQDIAEQSRVVLDSAMVRGKGLAEQVRLTIDNQKQNQLIADAQLQIGVYVAESNLLSDDEFVLGQLATIEAAREALAANNERIAELKSTPARTQDPEIIPETINFCPSCGSQLREGAAFCHICGTKL